MNRRQFIILVTMIAIAVGAVVFAQLYWINNAYKLQEANFSHSVQEALQQTAGYIEENNTCFEAFNKITLGERQDIIMLRRNTKNNNIIDTVRQYISSFDDDSLVSMDDLSGSFPVTAEIQVKYHYTPEEDISDSSILNLHNNRVYIRKDQYNDFFSGTFPLNYVSDGDFFTPYTDSLLKHYLNEEGLDPDYYFVLTNKASGDTIFGNTENKDIQNEAKLYTASLYNKSAFFAPQSLNVWVPHQNRYVLGKIFKVLLGSFLVLLFLGGVVVIIIRTILKQKKLSEVKNDFINNMTHEFKTPIANISLALQTLGNISLGGKRNLEDYLSVISAENNRLSDNVEKILQLSVMTNEQIKLKQDWTDFNEVINEAANCINLIEKTTFANISVNASVENYVYIDKVHFSNVIYNLIDNAIKYNAREPDIRISAAGIGNQVHITVADNGMGIPVADLPYIFDRFYRVSTGNLHDVKGFGLGLSYVKEIIESHGGSIKVQSKPGKGSVFTIVIPVNGMKERTNGVSVKKLLGIW